MERGNSTAPARAAAGASAENNVCVSSVAKPFGTVKRSDRASPPNDLGAEQAVLGAVLLTGGNPEITDIVLALNASDFYRGVHQRIFTAMKAVHEAGQPIDMITVAATLRQHGLLDEAGGEEYLAALLKDTAGTHPFQVQAHADIVTRHARHRDAITAAQLLAEYARDKSADPGAVRDFALTTFERLDVGSRQPSPKSSWTVSELFSTHFEPLRWVVPDLLPDGLTILGGRPKVGKSLLTLQIAGAVASGGKCLGRDVEQGAVLLLALEDGPRRLKERMAQQMWPPDLPLTAELRWPLFNEGGLSALRKVLAETDYRLCIIDTFSRTAGGSLDQDSVGEVTELLSVVQAIGQDTQTAIVVQDHMNKAASDNPVDAILGSTAKAAVPDCIIGLYRRRGTPHDVLSVVGRDVEGAELPITLDGRTLTWQLAADEHGVVFGSVQNEVLEALWGMDGKATQTELATATGKDRSQVYRELQELIRKGAVVRGEREGHAVPYILASHDGRQSLI